MSKKLLIATASLLITRDAMTILPVTVPAHEVEVAQAVFGEENVQVLDEQTAPAPLEVDNEAARLEAKWGPDALEKAFGANYKGKIAREAAAKSVGEFADEGDGEGEASEPAPVATGRKSKAA